MPIRATSMHDAVVLIDKPRGWTSFDAVNKLRRMFRLPKAGHAGTLDPQATGLLIVCTGRKTREVDAYVGLEKEYVGTMELGVRTPSYDSETDVVETRPLSDLTMPLIEETAAALTGLQEQEPPMYSAVKYGGKPLYAYARRGRTVERQSRTVEVKEFEIVCVKLPLVEFRVVCSKGTYIRSLVNDFGLRLGCGATLRELRRTRIGSITVAQAHSFEQLEAIAHTEADPQQQEI
jgi:tRNA pseudouridine55 synthase